MEFKEEKVILQEHLSFYCSKDLKNSIEKVAKKYFGGRLSTSIRVLISYAIHEAKEGGEEFDI